MRSSSLVYVVLALIGSVLASQHVLVNSLHEAPSGWVKSRDVVDPSQPIRLRIALVQPNRAVFEQKVYDVSTPQHPLYGKHMTRQEVKDLLRPRVESTTAVLNWLKTSGISATDIEDAGEWINFKTNASMAGELLGTRFDMYRHIDTDAKRLRTLQYQVPSEIRPHITMIQPTTRFGDMRAQRSFITEILDDENVLSSLVSTGNIPSEALGLETCNYTITPDCLRTIYQVNDTIADPAHQSILSAAGFLEQYAKHRALDYFILNLAPYAGNQNFSYHLVHNGLSDEGDFVHDDSEGNLDIEYIAALGYPSDLRYYSTGGRGPLVPDLDQPNPDHVSNEPFLDFMMYMTNLNDDQLPNVLSISYGENEQSVPMGYADIVCYMLGELSGRGVSVIVSSGDSGPGNACQTNDGKNTTRFMPTFPGACPFVTSVGGTQYVSPERAAFFSSGGFSDIFQRPLYQSKAVSTYLDHLGPERFQGLYEPNGRGFPDIAAQSYRFNTKTVRGTDRLVSGTSASAPVIAGLVGMLNSARKKAELPPLGFLNPLLYSDAVRNASAITDIIHGGSKGCNTHNAESGLPGPRVIGAGWNATEGWDPVTGLGTPLFDRLLALAAPGVQLPKYSNGSVET